MADWSMKPTAFCPYCGQANNDVTSMNADDNPPTEGAVSVCWYCGHIGVFTGNGLEVRRPSPKEEKQIMSSPKVRKILAAVLAAAPMRDR